MSINLWRQLDRIKSKKTAIYDRNDANLVKIRCWYFGKIADIRGLKKTFDLASLCQMKMFPLTSLYVWFCWHHCAILFPATSGGWKALSPEYSKTLREGGKESEIHYFLSLSCLRQIWMRFSKCATSKKEKSKCKISLGKLKKRKKEEKKKRKI